MIRIVIVGGGAAGAALARELSKTVEPAKHSLTLVTARPFNIILPAAVRMTSVASEHIEDKMLIPYDTLFINGNGTVITGRVTSVGATKGQAGGNVVLESGEKVEYDILVLAPGNTWSGPLDFPDGKEAVLEHIHQWQEKFASAKSVVMVGGGAVGIGTSRRRVFSALTTLSDGNMQNTLEKSATSSQRRRRLSCTTKPCY